MEEIAVARTALSHVPFRYYIAAHFLSLVGMWMERIALGWLAWQITGSTFWTSFVTMANVVPTGLLGPFIAVFVENWDTRRTMIAVNATQAAISFVIFLLVILEAVQIELLAVLAVALGLVSAVGNPARLVMVSLLVPRNLMPSAVSLSAVSFNCSRVIGPALAGISVSFVGFGGTFLFNTLSYLPFIAVMAMMPLLARTLSGPGGLSWFDRLGSGLRSAFGNKVIAWSLVFVALNGLTLRGTLENLPAYVGGVLDGDISALTILSVALGVGAIFGAILVGIAKGEARALIRQSMLLYPVAAAAVAGIGFAPPVYASVALVFLGGLCATTIAIGTQTIIHLAVDEDHRARVLAWWGTFGFGALSIGGTGLGAVGELVPMGHAIVALNVIGVVGWYLLLLTSRKML